MINRSIWIGCCLGVLLALGAAAAGQDRQRIDLSTGPHDSRSIADELDRAIMVQPASNGPALPSNNGTTALVPVSLMLRVEFGFGLSRLTAQAQRTLEKVALALNDPRLQSRRFVVEGHTDVVGSDESNMRLSQQRAMSVANYLQQQGVRADRLAVQGYGKTQLLSGISPTDGRNRRVEIVPMQ